MGRWRTVLCGTWTCSRTGAKKQCRRRYSPRAHRLARPVVIVVCWCMVHSFPQGEFSSLNPMRGNIPLAGVHLRALLASVTVLLHGAKTWQLRRIAEHSPVIYWVKGSQIWADYTAPKHDPALRQISAREALDQFGLEGVYLAAEYRSPQ